MPGSFILPKLKLFEKDLNASLWEADVLAVYSCLQTSTQLFQPDVHNLICATQSERQIATWRDQQMKWFLMHQSIPAAPMPPPRANPRVLACFFSWMANSPGVGTRKLPNAPRWGRRKRANAPPPGSYVPNQHCSSFHSFHNHANFSIKCVIFCFCRPASPSSIVCNGTIRC